MKYLEAPVPTKMFTLMLSMVYEIQLLKIDQCSMYYFCHFSPYSETVDIWS